MNKKLIIGVVVVGVVVLALGGVKIWTSSNGGEVKETQTSTETTSGDNDNNKSNNENANNEDDSKDSENSKDGENQSVNSQNNSNTSDTNSQQSTGSESKSSDKDYKNTNSNSSSNTSSNTSIKTPYDVSVTGMRITKIGGYSGTFVEDGSNKSVSNILTLEIKNTSKKDLQYGEIKLKINDKKTAAFKLTNLPAGKSVTVMESTGSISYNSGDSYKYEDATYAVVDELPMNKNKVKVSTSGSSITIENTSDKDLGTVYVYYKNTKGSSYFGGITYRAKFEDVKKGKSYTGNTSHFSEGSSEIVMIDTEN